jgi:hypothetical protein
MNLIIFSIGLISFGGLVVLGVALWIYFEMRKKETANGHKKQSPSRNNDAG